jgi:hypothetical protein
MTFFPFKKEVVYDTNEIKRIMKTISSKTVYKMELEIKSSNKSFKELEGSFNREKFIVRRLLNYGYSAFLVLAEGELKDDKLIITYKFHQTVIILLVLIFLFLLFISINSFDIIDSLSLPFVLYLSLIIIYNVEFHIIKNILGR